MIWQLYCCLTSLCIYRQINSYQPPSGYLSMIWSASGGSARDLRRQQAQGVPEARKKAGFVPTGAVCRSGTRLPVHSRASPPEGKAVRLSRISSIRRRHLAGRVPRAKRLGRRRRNLDFPDLFCARNVFFQHCFGLTQTVRRRRHDSARAAGPFAAQIQIFHGTLQRFRFSQKPDRT